MFGAPLFGTLGTWAVGIIIVGALMGLSFVKGMAFEGDRRLAEDAKVFEAKQQKAQVVEREVEKVRLVYVSKKQQIEKDHDIAIQEVIDHAKTLPDPPECWLPPERVRTINSAWDTGPQAGDSGRPDAVPKPDSAAEKRQPAGGGAVGGGPGK